MKKLKHREIKRVSDGYKARKWQSQERKPYSSLTRLCLKKLGRLERGDRDEGECLWFIFLKSNVLK